jgi:hypothetical protein
VLGLRRGEEAEVLTSQYGSSSSFILRLGGARGSRCSTACASAAVFGFLVDAGESFALTLARFGLEDIWPDGWLGRFGLGFSEGCETGPKTGSCTPFEGEKCSDMILWNVRRSMTLAKSAGMSRTSTVSRGTVVIGG